MKTAVYGGSFDPIHNGHVELAQAFCESLSPDRLIVVPAFVSPFKTAQGAAEPAHRLEMCRLAFEGMSGAVISPIELEREGASYTCDTLTALSEMYPSDRLFLITGSDAFLTIQSWRSPEVIFEKAVICTVPRSGDDLTKLNAHAEYLHILGAETFILDAQVMTVSSTEIRSRVRAGESITGLVPPAVEDYITKHGLYR